MYVKYIALRLSYFCLYSYICKILKNTFILSVSVELEFQHWLDTTNTVDIRCLALMELILRFSIPSDERGSTSISDIIQRTFLIRRIS